MQQVDIENEKKFLEYEKARFPENSNDAEILIFKSMLESMQKILDLIVKKSTHPDIQVFIKSYLSAKKEYIKYFETT